MKRAEHTFDDLISDLELVETSDNLPKQWEVISFRVPTEIKSRYARLQKMSGRQFSRKAKVALLALIQAAESKAS